MPRHQPRATEQVEARQKSRAAAGLGVQAQQRGNDDQQRFPARPSRPFWEAWAFWVLSSLMVKDITAMILMCSLHEVSDIRGCCHFMTLARWKTNQPATSSPALSRSLSSRLWSLGRLFLQSINLAFQAINSLTPLWGLWRVTVLSCPPSTRNRLLLAAAAPHAH